MQVILTAREMRSSDGRAIRTFKIPGVVLMENAGRGAVDAIEEDLTGLRGRSALVVCGTGNNGGDGFVIARHLFNRGWDVVAALAGRGRDLRGDAKTNYTVLRSFIREDPGVKKRLELIELRSLGPLRDLRGSDVVIDALFGTGFKGEASGLPRQLIGWMNARECPKVAIDIPSGLDADTGGIAGVAVKADLTLTMGALKTGLITNGGRSHAGRIRVIDIGMPGSVLGQGAHPTFLLEDDDIRRALPVRPFNAHKHSVGKIFVLAGSRGLTGAAAMAALSAMKAGAGAVVLATASSVYPILAKKLTEVMVEPLDETEEGTISPEALPRIREHLAWADVAILGPGLSRNDRTRALVLKVLGEARCGIVLDADGLGALAEDPRALSHRRRRDVILTPHTGELSRIIGRTAPEIERERIAIARKTAGDLSVTLVLKGAPTVTAGRGGTVYVNPTGNPGMATAGSGDVLAGVIAGLWAQGMGPDEAAYAGVYLHGLAGDLARDHYGERSLLALDIQAFLPAAFRQLGDAAHGPHALRP